MFQSCLHLSSILIILDGKALIALYLLSIGGSQMHCIAINMLKKNILQSKLFEYFFLLFLVLVI